MTTGKAKADVLSHQYEKIFTKEDTNHMLTMGDSRYISMPEIVIVVAGVEKLLKFLNPKKAIGPDMLPTRMLKENADLLAPILTKIFHHTLDTSRVPSDWPKANFIAIFKKGKISKEANNRSISFTSVICKVQEQIIFSNIMDHAVFRKILVHFQHGFIKGHSCESQLINTVKELSKALNQNQQIDCLVLAFLKVFDTVAHLRLLHKLNYCGLRGSTLQWIKNWLTACSQSAMVDGDTSGEVHVASGVTQGTILGPLLLFLGGGAKSILLQKNNITILQICTKHCK